MILTFSKMHGLGNDFVLLDQRVHALDLSSTQIQLIADRRYGIGCDQLLVLDKPHNPRAQANYRVVNADGTPAEHCGNGIRCVARYLQRLGEIENDTVEIEIGNTLYSLIIEGENVRVDMGEPEFDPISIPLAVEARQESYRLNSADQALHFGAVSMGNPHAVFAVDDVDTAPVKELGLRLQDCELFPQKVNAGFAQFCLPTHIKLRVFERGAGETQACGTGACAAVAVGRQWGRCERRVDVDVRGGRLTIEWDGPGHTLWMIGPATHVYEGTIEI